MSRSTSRSTMCTSRTTWSVETINITNIQDVYASEDRHQLRTKFPTIPAEDANDYDECNEMTWNIRKNNDAILSFSQTLNYVLKGRETLKRVDIELNNFLDSAQFTQPSWDFTTKQFTRQCYKWLEDINRYESENGQPGQGSFTDHIKIATIVNRLKGLSAQHLMLKINTTTISSIAPTVAQRTSRGQLEESTKRMSSTASTT
eukprot:2947605-Amphidinium_carterae.1